MRFITLPTFGRELCVVMAAPASSQYDSLEPRLDAYRALGGNCLHIHGEGGETQSRIETGKWICERGVREIFFLASQICHDGWNELLQQEVNRFTPGAVREDIALERELIGTEYLDFAYFDDRPDKPFEEVILAIGAELEAGKLRAFGARNFSEKRLRTVHEYAKKAIGHGFSAVVTTEHSLFTPNLPLWPGYAPFDFSMKGAVLDLELTVFAHIEDFTLGQCLFGDEDALARMRPEWIERWKNSENFELAQRIQELASQNGATPREIQMACLLRQDFPVIAIISLPNLTTQAGSQLLRGAEISGDGISLSLVNHGVNDGFQSD